MQFFLLLPFIIYLFCVKRIFGYFATVFLIGVNIIISFIISMHFEAGISIIADGGINANYLYFKPWTRMGAYFVGVLFGMLYWEFKTPNQTGRRSIGSSIYESVKDS